MQLTLKVKNWQPAPIGKFLIAGLLFLSTGIQSSIAQSQSQKFNVLDFGAKPNSPVDAQPAIAQAIKAAQAWVANDQGRHAEVEFPEGIYTISKPTSIFAITIRDAINITITGAPCKNWSGKDCTRLVGAPASLTPRHQVAYNSFFQIVNSRNINVRNFYLDKAVPYFSQGSIQSVDSAAHTASVTVDPGYMSFLDPLVKARFNLLMVFTRPDLPFWDHRPSGCSSANLIDATSTTCSMFHILASAADSKGNWTLQLDRAAPGTFVGKPFLVWRNVGWQPAILIANSSNVELDHLFYTGGGGPAVHVQESDGNIVIRNVDVDVPAGSQSLFAATSGFNGTSNRAKILIDHVIVKHTDDDAFHFSSGPYFPVLDQSDGDRKIRIDLCYPGQFRPGDELAALEWATKKIIGKAHVMTIEIVTDSNKLYRRTCDLSLDRALPQLENLRTYSEQNLGMQQDHNARITNLSLSSMLTVSNSYLSSMRARCGIVQVPAVIKDNICANTPMAGFLVGPEYAWGEGYAVNGLNISGNTFDTVGGTAIYIADIIDSINSPTEADIRSKRTSSDALRDNQNIQILDNRFCNLGAVSRGIMGIQGAAITVSNAQGVVIRGNTYGCNASPNVLPQSRIIISPYSTDAVAH